MIVKIRILLFLVVSGILAACRATDLVEQRITPAEVYTTVEATPAQATGMPNPASVNCEEQGYTLEMRQEEAGTYGICLFPDGSECEEWSYFRGECQPGNSLIEPSAPPITPKPPSTLSTATATSEPWLEGWQRYTNETPAYTFFYPPKAIIESNDDPRRSVTIVGPLEHDEKWPMFLVSHPQDRAEFKLPAGVDLEQWLIEQNLLPIGSGTPPAEVRQADRIIAGETTVHTRLERSQQSYGFDKYFFAHEGQLYSILLLHTGDREDWNLYNAFLDSFQFLPQAVQRETFQAPEACSPTFGGTYMLYDGDKGFCFLYPDDFDLFQAEDGSLTLYRESLLNTEAPSATISVEAAGGRTLADVTKQRLADFAFPDTEAQDVELGGQPASLLDNLPGQDLNRRLVAVYENQVFELTVARIGDDYGPVGQEAAELFDLIVGSWRFLDQDEPAGMRAGPECPGQKTGTVLLRNDQDGYCLLLPNSYRVDDTVTSIRGRSETAVYQDSPLDTAHARLFISVEDAEEQTLDEITQDYKSEVEVAVPGLDLAWSPGLMLDGVWANEFEQVPGQDLARVLMLVYDGRLYTLTFVADDPAAGQAYEEMQALYDLVTQTFSFLWRS